MVRKCPDLPCDVLFEDSEWKSVYVIINKQLPPDTPPTLNQMIRLRNCKEITWIFLWVFCLNAVSLTHENIQVISLQFLIACLGGFLNRKHDGFPGVKTMWIGIQRMKDFALAWEVFNVSPIKTCG